MSNSTPAPGKVFLVGAGPGDPGLLTRRAAELIERAELIALDALVSKEIAALIPKSTQVVYVGKRSSAHTLPQEEINQLLIDEAKKGKFVVRLKGGDPFVFGRGGEEAEDLVAAGVAFEVVPGISSSIAGPAYAGIPVTHRSHATSLTLVTGHEADGTTGINWEALGRLTSGTIVFLMGFANLPTISKKLIENGMPADRPVAVVSKATRPDQRTVTGTLSTIEKIVAEANLPTPAIIVVGDVVKMRDIINWFETKPLFGKRVVVTRAREQASDLLRNLKEAGADVLQFPTIEIEQPADYTSLDQVIEGKYDWIIFTSSNGVNSYFDRLLSKGKDARVLAGVKVACIGDATARDLRGRGINPDLVPERFISTALLPHLAADQTGIKTAVIRAEAGRDELIDELRRRGGEVDLAVAYRTVGADYDLDELRKLIADRKVDIVTFTSGSTVEHFYEKLTAEERAAVNGQALIASIGPTTSDAIRRYGKEPDVVAANPTIDELLGVILARVASGEPVTAW